MLKVFLRSNLSLFVLVLVTMLVVSLALIPLSAMVSIRSFVSKLGLSAPYSVAITKDFRCNDTFDQCVSKVVEIVENDNRELARSQHVERIASIVGLGSSIDVKLDNTSVRLYVVLVKNASMVSAATLLATPTTNSSIVSFLKGILYQFFEDLKVVRGYADTLELPSSVEICVYKRWAYGSMSTCYGYSVLPERYLEPRFGPENEIALVVPMDRKHVEELRTALKALNESLVNASIKIEAVPYGAGTPFAIMYLVKIDPIAYLNPASIAASLDRLRSIASDLANRVNGYVLLNSRIDSIDLDYGVLSSLSGFEYAFRLQVVSFAVPLILAIILAVPYVAEASSITISRLVGLVRLRGSSIKVVSRSIASVVLLMSVAGLGLGLGISMLIAYAYLGSSAILDLLNDYAFVGTMIVVVAVTFIVMTRKLRKVLTRVSIQDQLRTQLVPEHLLEPIRMDAKGWFALSIGLYFVVTGLLGFNALRAMMDIVRSGGSVFLIVVLMILMMFESVFGPFAPALLAYGVAKLVASNLDRFEEFVSRMLARSDKHSLVVKGFATSVRKRVVAIAILSLFALISASTTLIGATAWSTCVENAIDVGLGTKYVLYASSSHLGDVQALSKILSDVKDRAAIVFELGYASLQSVAGPGPGSAIAVAIVNPRTFDSIATYPPTVPKASELSQGRALLVEAPTTFRRRIENVTLFLGSKPVTLRIAGTVSTFPGIASFLYVAREDVHTRVLITVMDMEEVAPYAEKVIVFTNDENVAKMLKEKGFKLLERSELEHDPIVNAFLSMFAGGGTLMASMGLMVLAVAIASLVAYSLAREASRVVLLLRVRGASFSDVLRVTVLHWAALSLLMVLVVSVAGLPFAFGMALKNMATSGLIAIPTSIGMNLALWWGYPTIYVPISWLAIVTLFATLLVVLPVAVCLSVFRGVVRERFIEVR